MLREKKTETIQDTLIHDDPNDGNQTCMEKYCFFIGFLFPPAWFIGSSQSCCNQHPRESYALAWQKRCRIGAVLFLTGCIVAAAFIMVLKPSTFGIRGNSSGPQTSSDSESAIRPGVPANNSGNWDEVVADVRVERIM
ncbi:hypothetical protein K492DRAFT_194566 [Lichtheimia hyalospora FSU 10163]|nr:hypothetical protein K492DRAFT_194566 [Lichtheimia hyalospora FSU 10163]